MGLDRTHSFRLALYRPALEKNPDNMEVYYQIYRDSKLESKGAINVPFELGRQNESEVNLKPVCVNESGGLRRLVFAANPLDKSVPRQAGRVDLKDSQIVLHNYCFPPKNKPLRLCDGRTLRPDEKITIPDEVYVQYDNELRVRLSLDPSINDETEIPEQSTDDQFQSLSYLASAMPLFNRAETILAIPGMDAQSQAINLIRKAIKVFDAYPGTPAFFSLVVNSVREMLDVDRVILLKQIGDDWLEIACAEAQPPPPSLSSVNKLQSTVFSKTLVQKVIASRETQIIEPNQNAEDLTLGLSNVKLAVASPVFDESKKVIAVLYGDKKTGSQSAQQIGLLEASLLDVMANAVSNGLTRQKDSEFRQTVGQFFSKGVLNRLSNQKDLLEGKEAEVSILSCDIRGFSAISHRLGPAETIKWINEVLTSLSECVLNNDGVVVDYVGDAVMAMFGAPENQPDHADRACKAAIEMLATIPGLNEKFQAIVDCKFSIGIGVNSGIARVGNTGSNVKFKYGPLGSTVNMASRIEGVTKQAGVPCLITGSTHRLLKTPIPTRRIGTVRVVGIPESVDLFEVVPLPTAPKDLEAKKALMQNYETALTHFEEQKLPEAAGLLASIVKQWPSDIPSLLLLTRTVAYLNQTEPFDKVWTLRQK